MQKKYNESLKSQVRFACIVLGLFGAAYGCDESSGSKGDVFVCQDNLVKCGDSCCESDKCINNVCSSSSTTGGDVNNCGGEGIKCNPDEACINDRCVGKDEACSNNQTFCSGLCVNVKSDAGHCGNCETVCKDDETCTEGSCVKGCADGLKLVDNICVNPQIDSEHCGDSNTNCGDNGYCSEGKCECSSGYYDCDGKPGCESDIKCDAVVCTSEQKTCSAGNCCEAEESCCFDGCCEAGTTCCGKNACVDVQTDAKNCGKCGNQCPEYYVCVDGTCSEKTCEDGQNLCSGECYDLTSSKDHCGDCDTKCDDGYKCESSNCVLDCAEGLTVCGSTCADITKDNKNCGGCGNRCNDDEVCGEVEVEVMDPETEEAKSEKQLGCYPTTEVIPDFPGCGCEDGDEACVPKEECWGQCVDRQNDINNCGACGNVCGEGKDCVEGKCVLHCEDSALSPCNDVCVNVKTDINNCGACGNKCETWQECTTVEEVTTCVASEVDCNEGLTEDDPAYNAKSLCWGSCVNLKSDDKNCGACGVACEEGKVCTDGICKEKVEEPPTEIKVNCYGQEVDILSDNNNCGGCLVVCASDEKCENGQCLIQCGPTAEDTPSQDTPAEPAQPVEEDEGSGDGEGEGSGDGDVPGDVVPVEPAAPTYTRCESVNSSGKSTFACINLQTSKDNCGACGTSCLDGQACVGGTCQCAEGYYDCDGIAANGCESPVECTCKPKTDRKCWRGDTSNIKSYDADGVPSEVYGTCKLGTQVCADNGKYWGPCTGGTLPLDYNLDVFGQPLTGDNNCNGTPDNQETATTTRCDLIAGSTSYIGCEYWPVFLQNQNGFSTTTNVYFDLTLVISNPSKSETADVYVFTKDQQTSSNPYKKFTVAPGAVQHVTLVGKEYGSYGYTASFFANGESCAKGTANTTQCNNNKSKSDDGKIDKYMMKGTMQAASAFRVVSSTPIVVYQFNPYGKPETHSADASLLMPKSVLGNDYLTMGYDSQEEAEFADAVNIVAVEPGETSVTIMMKAATLKSADGKISAFPANGEPQTIKMNQFDVLSLEQSGASNSTGSRITATKRVEVFGSAGCGMVPTNENYCDHLEEQIFPLQTWGTKYEVVKSHARASEKDHYYILSSKAGTKVTLRGGEFGTKQEHTLGEGEYYWFETSTNFDVEANNPILVGQFLVGSAIANKIGDPSFILNVPSEQYRTEYSFAVPDGYEEDWVTIIAPKAAGIKYTGKGFNGTTYTDKNINDLPDTVAVAKKKTFGKNGYVYYYLKLKGGTHSLSGDQPFGVTGYGFFNDTSYGYPIGLDLKAININ